MAKLTASSGLVVRVDDEWMSMEDPTTRNGHFFFLKPTVVRPEIGRHWWGAEKRFDEQGRKWMRNIDRLVVDDFGSLVEVPA